MKDQSKKKVVVVFGTRPEAIKLAPVIRELRKEPGIQTIACALKQHGKLLDETLKVLEIRPDINLPVSLSDRAVFKGGNLAKRVVALLRSGMGLLRFVFFLKNARPALLVVQGDTSTAFLAAWIAFHFKIKIAHIEAGLRTGNKYAPFPEEMNRVLISRLADIHLTPTEQTKTNLLREGVREESIHIVGNTAVDAVLAMAEKINLNASDISKKFKKTAGFALNPLKKIILVTAHRRESFGAGLKEICGALKEIVNCAEDVEIIYPVHPNPNVMCAVEGELKNVKKIRLIKPLSYDLMVYLMSRSYLILTDSGGIQEEAPSLRKPILVMREETERVEGIRAGVSKLVGIKKESIVKATEELIKNRETCEQMTGQNPYGDGRASERITRYLINFLSVNNYK